MKKDARPPGEEGVFKRLWWVFLLAGLIAFAVAAFFVGSVYLWLSFADS